MADPVGEARVVDTAPSTLPLMVKAALPAVPVLNRLPGVRRHGDVLPPLVLTRRDVAVDRAHVSSYSQVCGFPLKDALPATYPHLLAFGLHLSVMTDPAFPFPAVGTVHLENSITQRRPVDASERLTVTVWPEGLRPHPRGRVFDMLTRVESAGEPVWEERSTFLRRGRGDAAAASSGLDVDTGRPDPGRPLRTSATWRLPGDVGRRYAAVSGDHNPIHLHPLTAKAFGFPRQIAHGMFSAACCLAALDSRLPGAFRVDVAFKKPILLPGSVAFGCRREDRPEDRPDGRPGNRPRTRPGSRAGDGSGHYAFWLTRPADGAPHLLGRTTGVVA